MLDAGSVYATLGARVSMAGFAQYDAAMKKSIASAVAAEQQTARSTQRMNAATAAMGSNVGRAAGAAKAGWLAVGVGAAVGLGKSVQAAVSFEKQMGEVQAVTKASGKDMKVMTEAARELGTKTGVGATQAARGLTELAKGGLSAKQSADALRGTIALAQAGNMDLADAASTVVQSLSTFNLGAKDATMVADGLASAANKTTMDVADFAQAFAQGGAAAQAAGMSFDDTLNVMGAMANRFKSGSDMGTSLKTTLTQLAHPTKKAQAEMNRLNIDLFDSKGKFKDAADVTRQLGDRFAEMAPKQRLASAAIIAGTDGMRTLLNLANAPRGDGQVRVAGAAAETATTKMDNLAGSWQRLKANMENVGITVGNELVPKLRDATDAIVKFMDEAQNNEGDGGKFARFLKGVGKVAGELGDTLGAVTSPGKFADLMNRLTGHKNLSVEVTAKVKDEASQILNNIINKPLKDKVVRILGNKSDVETKIRQLEALGISGPTAHFLAEMGSVSAARAAVAAPIRVPVAYVPTVMKPSLPGGLPTPKKKARGSGPDAGVSLVGEGTGAELAGNLQDGFRRVDRPTLMNLGADDWVLPVEQYPATALQLIMSMLGIPAFKKGKKPKKRAKAIHKDPIRYAEYLSPLEAEESKWAERVQRDESLRDDKAQSGKRKGKLTKKALEARKKLPKERAMLRQAKLELKSARDYGKRIEKQGDLANIYADDMNLATTDAQWSTARRRRTDALGRERDLLAAALKLAGGPTATSAWARALRKKLGETNIAIRDTGQETFDAGEQGTFTTAEQARKDEIEAAIAVAALTDTKSDDISAQEAMVAFLEPLLASAQQSGGAGRGGMSAITELAGELKGARDTLADLTRKPDLTADQQASADQQYQRGLIAGQTSFIDRLTAATIGGAPQLTVNFNSLTASPSDARKAADTIVGGISYQGGRPASTQRIGV